MKRIRRITGASALLILAVAPLGHFSESWAQSRNGQTMQAPSMQVIVSPNLAPNADGTAARGRVMDVIVSPNAPLDQAAPGSQTPPPASLVPSPIMPQAQIMPQALAAPTAITPPTSLAEAMPSAPVQLVPQAASPLKILKMTTPLPRQVPASQNPMIASTAKAFGSPNAPVFKPPVFKPTALASIVKPATGDGAPIPAMSASKTNFGSVGAPTDGASLLPVTSQISPTAASGTMPSIVSSAEAATTSPADYSSAENDQDQPAISPAISNDDNTSWQASNTPHGSIMTWLSSLPPDVALVGVFAIILALGALTAAVRASRPTTHSHTH